MSNYTKLWEAFAGGEYEGGTALTGSETGEDYKQRTQDFYDKVLGPTFYGGSGEQMGSGNFKEYIASFDEGRLEKAEATFRSAIGDPYVSGLDPFSWEKISRYDTEGGLDGALQSLLENELYSKGKQLGGKVGETYKTDTSTTLQAYKEGTQGQRESITHSALTSGQSLASGTSGATIKSGSNLGVAEDALTDIYKKTKTLGSEYRAGKEEDERSLEGDLDDALTQYISEIQKEKKLWGEAIMDDVKLFYGPFQEGDITNKLSEDKDWQCGYGEKWSGDPEVGCVADESINQEGIFRGNVCAIGQVWDETLDPPQCVELDIEGANFERDKWGVICADGLDECGECGGDGSSCAGCDGVPNSGAVVDACGVCGGTAQSESECDKGPITVTEEENVVTIEDDDVQTNWQDMLGDISNYWDNTSDRMQDIIDSLTVLDKPTGSGFRGKGRAMQTCLDGTRIPASETCPKMGEESYTGEYIPGGVGSGRQSKGGRGSRKRGQGFREATENWRDSFQEDPIKRNF